MRLTYTSPISEVAEIVDRCLVMGLPWPTRLAGVVEIVCQVCGPQTGVSFYGVVGSAQPLVLLCAAGKPGPVAVTWGAPVAGLAAREQAAQFAGEARALTDYLGGWIGVEQCLAVPVLRNQQLYGVLEVRSHVPDHLGLVQAELTAHIGARVAQAWPLTQQTGGQ